MDIGNQYGVLSKQEHLLVLLKTFHNFCIENGIKYSLDWGSLLGAVRHKGFIPWDDDIDIMVDRENNNKIVQALVRDNTLTYDFTSPETRWIGRIHLVENYREDRWQPTIDILVMDNAPDGKLTRKIRILRVLFFQGMLKLRPIFTKGNVLMRCGRFITFYLGKIFPRDYKLRRYHAIAQRSNRKNTKQITCYYEEFSCLGKYYSPELLDDLVLVPFEDTEVYAVKNSHECLCIQFGQDYMTPPDLSKRKPRHSRS